MTVIAKAVPAQAEPGWPSAVGGSWNTSGSAPAAVQTENAPSSPHEAMNVIPGSPTGHGSGSPKLQTVTVVVGGVLSFCSSSTTGTPVSPRANVPGMLGVAAAARSACAVPVESKVAAIGTTTSDTTARIDRPNLRACGLLLVLT